MITNYSTVFDNTLIQNLLETTGDNGLIIGKAKTMYTLYSYNIVETKNYDGEHHFYTVTCAFNKLLTKSLDKAKRMFPTLSINENLHGKIVTEKVIQSANTCEEHIIHGNPPCDFFQFGRYNGQKFNDCDDTSYLCWYYNKLDWHDTRSAMFRAELTRILDNRGAIPYMGSYYMKMTPQIAKLKAITDNCVDNGNEPFIWEIPCNLDNEGVIPMLDGVVMRFFYTKKNYTNYGNQIFACSGETGKGKRIKGKKLLIKKYAFFNNMKRDTDNTYSAWRFCEGPSYSIYPKLSTAEFLVKEFEILK